MKKDFDTWNKQKKTVHEVGQNKWCNERDIWWCKLGTNIGYEQDGKGEDRLRPVLVVKKFNQYVCLIVPLSTQIKKNPYYFKFTDGDGKEVSAITSQIRLVDTKRLLKREGKVSKVVFCEIKKAITDLFS